MARISGKPSLTAAFWASENAATSWASAIRSARSGRRPVPLLLARASKAIVSGESTPLSRSTQFLYKDFDPALFWWELAEMLRRFVLVGLMVLMQDTMMQLVTGTLLSAAFLLFQVQASPYVRMADDLLASAASFLQRRRRFVRRQRPLAARWAPAMRGRLSVIMWR